MVSRLCFPIKITHTCIIRQISNCELDFIIREEIKLLANGDTANFLFNLSC